MCFLALLEIDNVNTIVAHTFTSSMKKLENCVSSVCVPQCMLASMHHISVYRPKLSHIHNSKTPQIHNV